MSQKESWGFESGEEIAPGRLALERVGGGLQFEVYLAWDDQLFTHVIVKILRPDRVENPSSLSALEREAKVLSGLSHPYLMRIFDMVLDGDRPHLVLEHLEGPALRSLLKRYGRLSLDQLLPFAINLCSALNYLGSKNVVHLDVKPANIIIGENPRLVDFSVARTVEGCRVLEKPVGTNRFMSPEQARGAGSEIGPWSDIWGLGATLYEAASGVRPFPVADRKSKDPKEKFPQLFFDPAPLSGDIPTALQASLLRCLSRNASDRPSASELAHEIEPLIGFLPKPVLRRSRPKIR